MLGSRTKQVNCYGRRSQKRIVTTSAEKKSPFSPFLDLEEPATVSSPIKPKAKNRENLVHPVPKSRPVPSPKVTIPVRKRSPVAKPLVKQIKASVAPASQKEKPLIASVFKFSHNDTPSRTPLAALHPNGPGSPALPAKPRKPISPLSKGASTLKKPFSPFTEMDITVIDGEGRMVKKEVRRVSHADDSDADDYPIRRPRRLKSRAIVVSDDSESDIDGKHSKRKRVSPPIRPAQHKAKHSTSAAHSGDIQYIDLTTDTPPPPSLCHDAGIAPRPFKPSRNEIPATPPQLPLRHIFHAAKPRQLTPVRPGRNRLFAPPSPPSPCSTADLDDFAYLTLDSDDDLSDDVASTPEVPDYLRPLLNECEQNQAHEFSSFISAFPHDPILRSARTASSSLPPFRKVGEASYSEVFGIGDVVLKIIPIRDESPVSPTEKGKASQTLHHRSESEEGPAPTDARDVLKEVIVTRAMGDVHKGFVKLLKAYVVKGRYPQELLELWDEYYEHKGSESIRPDTFSLSQVYAIIVLPNGGPDLESYTFKAPTKLGWRQASSVFWQVAKSLAHAEQLVSFEHRDLHLGQVLVRDLPMATTLPLQAHAQNRKVKKDTHLPMDDRSHGVQVTLIDLGLSRMDAGDGSGGEMVHWTPFEEEVFEGEGDYQFDIYRMMRDQNGGDWESFKPLSNVMWLHYLLVKLLKFKGIKAPRKTSGTSASSGYSERDCYDCLVDLEQWLGQCVVAAATKINKPVKGKGRRKTVLPTKEEVASLNPICAGEIVEYGIKKRWIKSI
ncbi:hypothetical protein BDZ89DRAFT_975088 [Hymenopellis radicata]|nr:hypothetical protein BDZ89DRAFT_975088 [Hymenopellis radicata]